MLKTRKETEATKLVGVRLTPDPTKLELGQFSSLQNFVPAQRYKIKKKRGPADLLSTALSLDTPSSCGQALALVANPPDLECHNGVTSITITVTGGSSPYTWATTKGIITPGVPTSTAVLTPAANPGSATAGIAFALAAKYVGTSGFCDCVCHSYKCDDTEHSACTGFGCSICWPNTCSCSSCSAGADALFRLKESNPCGSSAPYLGAIDPCTALPDYHRHCDKRTPAMVLAGCNPCTLSMEGGAVVTVTDSLGQSIFIAIDSL